MHKVSRRIRHSDAIFLPSSWTDFAQGAKNSDMVVTRKFFGLSPTIQNRTKKWIFSYFLIKYFEFSSLLDNAPNYRLLGCIIQKRHALNPDPGYGIGYKLPNLPLACITSLFGRTLLEG